MMDIVVVDKIMQAHKISKKRTPKGKSIVQQYCLKEVVERKGKEYELKHQRNVLRKEIRFSKRIHWKNVCDELEKVI